MEECSNQQHCSKTNEVEVEETKKNSSSSAKFKKLWSDEDEITLLSGYYEYRQRKGTSDNASGFYEFIKPRLIRSSVKQHQISDKICRLKRKYIDYASKLGPKVEENDLDAHLEKLFELSRRIWPIAGNDSNNVTDENMCGSSQLSPLPLSPLGVRFEISNNFLCEEFLDFLYHEGVDVDLLDPERVRNLKRKFGEVEVARSKFEYKQAKLRRKLEKLKFDHYKRALEECF